MASTVATTQHPKVFQHNLLVRAPYKMSVLESRIFYLSLSFIHQKDEDFREIHIPMDLIIGDSTSGKSYNLVRKACTNLKQININVLPVEANKADFDEISLFDRIRFVKGHNVVSCWFSASIKPYLLDLKKTKEFTVADIEKILSLNKPHYRKMYCFLKSIRNQEYQQKYLIDDLRMMLVGDTTTYPKWGEFNKHVLKASIQAINELVDVQVDSHEVKENGKTAKVYFSFAETPNEVAEKKALVGMKQQMLDFSKPPQPSLSAQQPEPTPMNFFTPTEWKKIMDTFMEDDMRPINARFKVAVGDKSLVNFKPREYYMEALLRIQPDFKF